MSKPDNPPAFPLEARSEADLVNEGMTLRDFFAAAALVGLAATRPADNAARDAYEYADAMLAERQKGGE